MIHEVFDEIDSYAADVVLGLNARVTQLNAELELGGVDEVPLLETIQIWGELDREGAPTGSLGPRLPGELELPALVIAWDGTPRAQGVSSGKRKAWHSVRFYYFAEEPDAEVGRRHMAHMTKVIARWVDGLVERGTICQAQNLTFEPRRWLLAGQGGDVRRMEGKFEIYERDETP